MEPNEEVINEAPPVLTDDMEAAPTPTPPQVDEDAIGRAWAEKNGYAPIPPQQQTPTVDPRLEQIVELSYTNPAAAEAMRLQLAEERAEARILERMGPHLAKSAFEGVDDLGKEYLNKTLSGVHPAQQAAILQDPQLGEVFRRAANDYAREKTPTPAPRHESAYSERELFGVNSAAIREFEQMTGDKVSKEVLREALR